MLLSVAEHAYLSRSERVEALFARLRYLGEDEARALLAATRPRPQAELELALAVAAAWGVASYGGRLAEAEFAADYVGAFLRSCRWLASRGRFVVWPVKDVWRALEDRAVPHALALVVGDLLDETHLETLLQPAFESEPP